MLPLELLVSPPTRPVIIATFVLLTAIWGTTWAAIRLGLAGIAPMTGVALRFAIASILLGAVGWRIGVRFGKSRVERRLWLLHAALSFCGSYGIVYWCEQWIPSGLTSVLFSTMPLFVTVLAHFMLEGERLKRRAVIGIAVGLGGVATIFSEDFASLAGPRALLASAVLLLAPFFSAVASVVTKRWGKHVHPISLSAVPMGITAVSWAGSRSLSSATRRLVSTPCQSVPCSIWRCSAPQ